MCGRWTSAGVMGKWVRLKTNSEAFLKFRAVHNGMRASSYFRSVVVAQKRRGDFHSETVGANLPSSKETVFSVLPDESYCPRPDTKVTL